MNQTSTAAPASNPLAVEGGTITVKAGSVVVAVQCIRPGAAYRFAVRNTDGFEIEALAQSFAAENTARNAARVVTLLLRSGFSVQELIDLLASAQEVSR